MPILGVRFLTKIVLSIFAYGLFYSMRGAVIASRCLILIGDFPIVDNVELEDKGSKRRSGSRPYYPPPAPDREPAIQMSQKVICKKLHNCLYT